jgi:hypothetical protein
MKHKAHIAHHTHGRTRMKVPSGKGNQEVLDHFQKAMSGVPGVEKVETNVDTGSVVVYYDPRMKLHFDCALSDHVDLHHPNGEPQAHARPGDEVEDAMAKIQAEAEFLAQHSESAKAMVEFCKSLDHQIKVSTNNAIDLKIVLAGGLTVYTFLAIGAHAATPMWVTLALFGLNHFAELHAPHNAAQAVRVAEATHKQSTRATHGHGHSHDHGHGGAAGPAPLPA